MESSYNWTTDGWGVPINAQAAKPIAIGAQSIRLFAGVRNRAESPTSGPDGFGDRFGSTHRLPK